MQTQKAGILLSIPGTVGMRGMGNTSDTGSTSGKGGTGEIHLRTLLLDYNGTLALDGALLDGVPARLAALSELLEVQVVTADTFGTVQKALLAAGLQDIAVHILPAGHEADAKLAYLQLCGAKYTCAMGNGRNDRKMLEAAALSIAIMGGEGLCVQTMLQAHVVVGNILDALDLLLHPGRCKATLRE